MKIYTTVIAAMFGLLMMAMPTVASAEVVRFRAGATGGGSTGGRAGSVHDRRVLSAVGMREPVLPPSSLVELPLN